MDQNKIAKAKITIFEGKKIRRHWDGKAEKWYFSVVDVIQVLAQTDRPRKYWDDLKRKLKEEGSEVSEKIGQLKMIAEDGKSIRDESEPIIRLADMWAGCVRSAISNGGDEKVILDQAKKSEYAHEIAKTKIHLKEMDKKISRLAKLSLSQSLPKGQAFAEIFNSIVANYLSLSIVIHAKRLSV